VKNDILLCVHEDLVRPSQRTQSIRNTNWLLLFTESVISYCELHTERKKTVWRKRIFTTLRLYNIAI